MCFLRGPPQAPVRLAVLPDGKTVVCALQEGRSVAFVDVAAQKETQQIPLGGRPVSISLSPDGRLLAGFLNRDDGIALYSLASRTFRRLTGHGADPVWLSDSRRILFLDGGKIHLLDSASGSTRELVSVMPEQVARRGFAVSPDDRHIYFSVSTTEADVWKIEFERLN